MAHINCPSCSIKLRTPRQPTAFRCPSCRKTLVYAASGEVTVRPDRSQMRQSLYWRRFLFEGTVALVGFACLGPLFALQKYVLVPVGLENPFTKQIVMPGMIDEEGNPGKPLLLITQYNGVLYWGRIASFSVMAALLWFAFWRIKRRLTRRERLKKKSVETPPPPPETETETETETAPPDTKKRVRVGRTRSLGRFLAAVYKDETPGWVLWGGGTASAIVLAAGALSAILYR